MLVNLTPHPVHIYSSDTADRIERDSIAPVSVVPVSETYHPARLGQTVVGTDDLNIGIPVEVVEFGTDPNCGNTLPDPLDGVWYVVSLVVGLAAQHRNDLLVVHDYVRDMSGSILGCRKLARPHRS